jgi:glycosyltransferase involved in cell wall biosynthesis
VSGPATSAASSAAASGIDLSVIVPVGEGGPAVARCLAALAMARARVPRSELIVVADGSQDGSAERAAAAGARVLRTPRSGPAAARNVGAEEGRGEILFFVDADVAVRPDTLERVVAAFRADPALDACFGSYDDVPGDPGFLSQYRNLFHHFVHQSARAEATTFWSGCGAIRRALFVELGGFDARRYRRPSIEDIDLGYRLLRARPAARIRLIKDLQVCHLKRWTVAALLRSDIRDRGIPWTRLLWREKLHPAGSGANTRDLNLQVSNRASVVLVWLLLTVAALGAVWPGLWLALAPLALGLLALNWPLYAFFARVRGRRFALAAIPWHWLYYSYNLLSFAAGSALFAAEQARQLWRSVTRRPAPETDSRR